MEISINDILKKAFSYGLLEQQEQFLFESFYLYFGDDASNFKLVKQQANDNTASFTCQGTKFKVLLAFNDDFFNIILYNGFCYKTIYYSKKNKILNVYDYDTYENIIFTYKLQDKEIIVSYYDSKKCEELNKVLGKDFCCFFSLFSKIKPSVELFASIDEYYIDILEKAELMKTTNLSVAIFYTDESNNLKIL